MGREGAKQEGGITEKLKEAFVNVAQSCSPDCGDGFAGTYICQSLSNYIF